MSLPPITPGISAVFQLTPEPAGIATDISQIGWAAQSSDGTTDVSMTSNTEDPTGMTATLSIDSTIAVGANITFWGTYRNLSGSQVLIGPITYTVT